MKQLILDLDTGIDDALAILYALGLEQEGLCRLAGITCTFGNVTAGTAARNSRALLGLLGREDIPVFAGSNRRFGTEEEYEPDPVCRVIHGENGIGNVDILMPEENFVDSQGDALRFLADMAERYEKDLAVIATASMANIARWLKGDRETALKAGRIAIMGGALTVPGNVTPFAEANMLADPEAARFVFESGAKLLMTGLDATLRTSRGAGEMEEKMARWGSEGGRAGRVFLDMLTYYCENESQDKVGAIHDPLAVAAVFKPKLVTTMDLDLTVETEGPSRGRTIGDMRRFMDGEKTARVCVDADGEGFLEDFSKVCLKGLLAAGRR